MSKQSNTRALWQLTRGQRGRFAAALLALAIGAGFMYVGPQFVRLAIDGILEKPGTRPIPAWAARALAQLDVANHPARGLVLFGCAILAATLIGGAFMYLKGRW